MQVMKMAMMDIIMVFLVVFLSGCSGSITGQAITPTESKVYDCTGDTSATLQDYCYDLENDTLKFLVRNNFLAELKHMNVVVNGDSGTDSQRHTLRIEINEQRILEHRYPSSIGYPLTVETEISYFGNSGLESCVPIEIDFTEFRECGKSADRDEVNNYGTDETG